MKLQIEQPYVDAMINQFPELSSIAEQLRFGNRALVALEQLNNDSLGYLYNLYEGAGLSNRAAQIATLRKAIVFKEILDPPVALRQPASH